MNLLCHWRGGEGGREGGRGGREGGRGGGRRDACYTYSNRYVHSLSLVTSNVIT